MIQPLLFDCREENCCNDVNSRRRLKHHEAGRNDIYGNESQRMDRKGRTEEDAGKSIRAESGTAGEKEADGRA